MSSPQEWIDAVEKKMGKKLSSAQKSHFTWWVKRELTTPVGCDITRREVKHWAQFYKEHRAFVMP